MDREVHRLPNFGEMQWVRYRKRDYFVCCAAQQTVAAIQGQRVMVRMIDEVRLAAVCMDLPLVEAVVVVVVVVGVVDHRIRQLHL